MLRHLDQHGGGVLVYTRSLLEHLLRLESEHEFVLFYPDEGFVGSYPRDGVTEVVIHHSSRLLWDQVGVFRAARTEDVDVIFNPKYSLPLLTPLPTVFVCHGLDWFVNPQWSRWTDRLSHRVLIPRYMRKADRIIAVSNTVRKHILEFMDVPDGKIDVIHLGIDDDFREPVEPGRRQRVRRHYDLPDRYFLYCGQIYPPKNFGRLVRAFARVGPPSGIHLVVAGTHTWRSEDEIRLVEELGIGEWVSWAGWVDHEDLPVFYDGALALVMPSLYEACPAPPIEAMAVGCPVITSNRYGTNEVAGDAAIFVDPEDVDSIASGMQALTDDPGVRDRLIERGRARAGRFEWNTCARRTLEVVERACTGRSA